MAHRGSSAPIHRLDIAASFHSLTSQEKRYAHHLSKAAWYGSRIVMRQVSPEAPSTFDFILEVHRAVEGIWSSLVEMCQVSEHDVDAFLDFAATFLSNLGNYYGSGDQKFVPQMPKEAFLKLGKVSEKASTLLEEIIDPLYAIPPYSLGSYKNLLFPNIRHAVPLVSFLNVIVTLIYND